MQLFFHSSKELSSQSFQISTFVIKCIATNNYSESKFHFTFFNSCLKQICKSLRNINVLSTHVIEINFNTKWEIFLTVIQSLVFPTVYFIGKRRWIQTFSHPVCSHYIASSQVKHFKISKAPGISSFQFGQWVASHFFSRNVYIFEIRV